MGIFDQGNSPYGRGGGGGSGIGARLLGALLIVAFAWIMYASHTEENPVTGEKQRVSISPSQEIRLGLETAPEMSREMGGELPASDPRTQIVQEMGRYLLTHSIAQKSPWKFQFHLLADPKTVNAFALPGGQIFITKGLFDKLQTEAQLAGVLGHEMGHVIERHTAQQMAKNQFGQMVVVAVGSAASDNMGSTPYMIAALVNQMMQLRYSRHDESEADSWGLKLMTEAGYDPRAMVEVMEILKAAGGGRGESLEIFQTHPNPDLRIQQIKEYLKTHPVPDNVTEGKNLHDLY